MLKIVVMDDAAKAATKELLTELCADLPVHICCGRCGAADVLVINKAPAHMAFDMDFPPKTIVANTDDRQVLRFISTMDAHIVAYGFNPKAAITASSRMGDNFVVCIQRAMVNSQGAAIMPREFTVNIAHHPGSDEGALAAVAAALICGASFQ